MNQNLELILNYVGGSEGLQINYMDDLEIRLLQKADSRELTIKLDNIEKVLQRVDSEGKPFIQINFVNGHKLLMTESLFGFRPAFRQGLDMNKVPNVVTTPDLIGVIEALEDSLSEDYNNEDLEILKKLFYSVLDGAESVGFDLTNEKSWLNQIHRTGHKASA